jgi:hypothetical protein
MQGIYNYISETNHLSGIYNATILLLQCKVHVMLFPMINVLYFDISTFHRTCADGSFLHDKAPMTAPVLRDKIKGTPCSNDIKQKSKSGTNLQDGRVLSQNSVYPKMFQD